MEDQRKQRFSSGFNFKPWVLLYNRKRRKEFIGKAYLQSIKIVYLPLSYLFVVDLFFPMKNSVISLKKLWNYDETFQAEEFL